MSHLVIDPVRWADILANPQRHIDDLVKAGVLELPKTGYGSRSNLYRVTVPHVHQWQIVDAPDYLRRWVTVGCSTCGERREGVPNTLPIEVPS